MRSFTPLLFCLPLLACSTVRLTPTAAKYAKLEDGLNTAIKDGDVLIHRRALLEYQITAVLVEADKDSAALKAFLNDNTITKFNPEGIAALTKEGSTPTTRDAVSAFTSSPDAETLNVSQTQEARARLARELVILWATDPNKHPFLTATFSDYKDGGPAPAPASAQRLAYLEEQIDGNRSDIQQLTRIKSGKYEYFVEGSLFFSIEPVVAIRKHLGATAIPSLAVNFRPALEDSWGYWDSALAMQLVLGGALNPSGGGDAIDGGAAGVGVSYPIAGVGSISAGGVWFNEADGDSDFAPYISVTLGNFGKSTK